MQARAQFDARAQQCGDSRHDRQPESEALAVVAFGIADLEEFVEYPWLVDRRDADAVVADFDADAIATHACRKEDAATLGGGLDRIVQQAPEQAAQHAWVGEHGMCPRLATQLDTGVPGGFRLSFQQFREQ